MNDCQNGPKPRSSSKRGLEPPYHADNERPLKRQRFFDQDDQDDFDWLKREISDIKICITQIAEHLRSDVDTKLEEIIDRIRQLDLP